MGGIRRKQYLEIAGLPILCHTLRAIDSCDSIDEIILVIPAKDIGYCPDKIVNRANISKKISIITGGAERRDSVYNGILAVTDSNGLVLIHDGVRPFIRPEQIDACISAAENFGASILGVRVHDTIKNVTASGFIDKTLPRDTVWLAQTPQVFKYSIIKDAFEHAIKSNYSGTDDASLVEKMGQRIKIIEGSRLNIKITTQEDIQLAQAIIHYYLPG